MDLDRRIWMKRSICWTRASWASKTPNLSKTDSAFPVCHLVRFENVTSNISCNCFKMSDKAVSARAGSWRPSPVWLFSRKILLTWSSGRKTRRSQMGLLNSTFSVFHQLKFLLFLNFLQTCISGFQFLLTTNCRECGHQEDSHHRLIQGSVCKFYQF